jgi:von Willebrand factor type A domain
VTVPQSIAAGSRVELVWTNLPASWGVFVLIGVVVAMVYAVFALYRRELQRCPLWAKMVLALLRTGVFLLLAGIFLGPAVVSLQTRKVEPTIVVLRDASQSMNTADAYAERASAAVVAAALGQSESEVPAARPSRVQIVNELLVSSRLRLLAELSHQGRVEIADFAEQVTQVDVPRPLVAEGRGTDLAGAIRQSLATDRVAAIVMFTDGQHTAREDALGAAREAKSRGVPLLIVGVGDAARRTNIQVASVYSRPQAWQEEPFEIDAVVRFQDVPPGQVRVELLEQQRSAGTPHETGGAVVQSLQLQVPDSGSGQHTARFSHLVREPGQYTYQVRVEPVAGDTEQADNLAASGLVRVLSRERMRVLLVAGSPTWDYRLVQQLLARDKTITLSCWLQTLDEGRAQEGTRPISRLPITTPELFFYDVVLLFDPDPQEIDRAWIDLLQQFVGEHAGGLLYMAGPKHTNRLLMNSRTADFARLLPVSFGDFAALEVAALLSSNQRAWPLQVVPANGDHPVLQFYPAREESLRRWRSLPGVFWSFPCQQAKPTAEVLVEHSDPALASAAGARPLLVAGRSGAGHTLWLGFNGTWRWRKAGQQAEYFDKFWIQAIRFLVAGRSLAGGRRGTLESDRDRYEIGERITLTARLQDAAYEPLVVPQVSAVVEVAGQAPQTVTFLPLPNRPGAYETNSIARHTGIQQVRVLMPASAGEGGQIETSFRVELPSVETDQVWLNRPLLVELASLSGGRYFDVNQLDELTNAVPDRTETIESRSQPRPLWDAGHMLAALVGLLCTEWLLRKRFKLL